jgi:hypothetical protein
MSKIIKQFEEKIKFTDHVYVTESRKGGKLTIRTNNDTKMPKGIYTLWLEGTEDTPGFGMLYLGISGADKQTAREGIKQRWLSHAFKMTGISFADRTSGNSSKGRVADTKEFAKFRKQAHDLGYDLDTILDKLYIRFINMEGVGVEKIKATEGRIIETRIAKGQCALNGAKRRPALTIEELTYFDNL